MKRSTVPKGGRPAWGRRCDPSKARGPEDQEDQGAENMPGGGDSQHHMGEKLWKEPGEWETHWESQKGWCFSL